MGESSALGLTPPHAMGLESYLRFCRRQRADRLRSIDASFNDVIASRLLEETYTREEVEELMDNLSEVVRNEVERELIHNSHSNSVLVSALCLQAQKWHLELVIDIAQLENQEKLAMIEQFETSGPQGNNSPVPLKLKKLAPLQAGESSGPAVLLENHIEKLTAENSMLLNQVKELEDMVKTLTLEKENINLDQSASRKEINFLRSTLSSKPKEEEISQLNSEISFIKSQFDETKALSNQEKEKIISDLTSTETSLRQVRSQLTLAEKELERKFSQTGAYKNLKKMLAKKNEQIRQLRQKLEIYEPDSDCQVVEDE